MLFCTGRVVRGFGEETKKGGRMKRAKIESLLRRKIRLKITSQKRGPVALVMRVDGVVFKSTPFPNKKTALVALYARLRCASEIVLGVESVKGGAK
jgi:hypothetical protein